MTRPRQGTGKLRALFVLPVFLAILLLLQGLAQRAFERRYPDVRIENLLYVPRGQHLKVMSLGFRNIMADALWAKAIGYFGGHYLTDKEYPWLYHILDQVTSLDPLFRHPYLFGGIVLALEEQSADKSIALMAKGMDYHPDDWRLPFYIGFNYFFLKKDPSKAAAYLRVAATLPGHPQYLPRLAATLMTRSGHLDAAITFLETVAASTEEEYVREGLYEKIRALREGRIPAGLETFLSREEKDGE